jgi:hypothetical protein
MNYGYPHSSSRSWLFKDVERSLIVGLGPAQPRGNLQSTIVHENGLTFAKAEFFQGESQVVFAHGRDLSAIATVAAVLCTIA